VLRLDLLLLAAHHLNALTTVSHLCEEEDVMEVSIAVTVTVTAYKHPKKTRLADATMTMMMGAM
jgi:hypothetical protein